MGKLHTYSSNERLDGRWLMMKIKSTTIPSIGIVAVPPVGGGLSANKALPWLIDVDVAEQAVANTNWDTLSTGLSDSILLINKRSSGAQNDSISFDVVLAAGTWTVELLYQKDIDHGIFSIQFDSVEKGTIDSYGAASSRNNLSSVTGITVTKSAKIRLSLVMATKNASSSSYQGRIQHIQLRRTA